jgi:anti-sigma-K factor RskA
MSTTQHDNAAPYALGALSEIETRAFERHLGECADCRAELERLLPAVDALALAPEPVAPSPGVKRELMRRVAEEPSVESAGTEETGPARRRRLGAGLAHQLAGAARPAIVAAALAMAALAGIAGYGLGRGDEEGRTLAANVDRARIGDASAELELPGDDNAAAILSVRGLPVPQPGRTYEAWVLRDGRAEPAGVFTVRADGTGEAPVTGDLRGADAVMVTRERAGGAVAPTERPLMVIRLD